MRDILTGYDNPLHFSRLFGRLCGYSLREYRKKGTEQ